MIQFNIILSRLGIQLASSVQISRPIFLCISQLSDAFHVSLSFKFISSHTHICSFISCTFVRVFLMFL